MGGWAKQQLRQLNHSGKINGEWVVRTKKMFFRRHLIVNLIQ
jgi:hypothetical protein